MKLQLVHYNYLTVKKSQKLIPSKKNQFLPIAKISPRETQKVTHSQN